jgi:hypothetical protein
VIISVNGTSEKKTKTEKAEVIFLASRLAFDISVG